MWQLLGAGQAIATLGPKDPPGSQIMFGINDNNLRDNSGQFNVVITEYTPGPAKCETPAQPGPGPILGLRVGSSTTNSPTNTPPCAGQTPNGQRQDFPFSMVCAGQQIHNFSESACSLGDAQTMAAAQAKSDNCILR
jgi:hypothetical protein